MRSLSKVIGIATVAIATSTMALAGVVHTESFEAAPGGSYSLITPFDGGGFDYFDQYPVPEPIGGNAARDDFQLGWVGSFGIQGQDHDGLGGLPTVSISMPGIG